MHILIDTERGERDRTQAGHLVNLIEGASRNAESATGARTRATESARQSRVCEWVRHARHVASGGTRNECAARGYLI